MARADGAGLPSVAGYTVASLESEGGMEFLYLPFKIEAMPQRYQDPEKKTKNHTIKIGEFVTVAGDENLYIDWWLMQTGDHQQLTYEQTIAGAASGWQGSPDDWEAGDDNNMDPPEGQHFTAGKKYTSDEDNYPDYISGIIGLSTDTADTPEIDGIWFEEANDQTYIAPAPVAGKYAQLIERTTLADRVFQANDAASSYLIAWILSATMNYFQYQNRTSMSYPLYGANAWPA